jgi:hypothetical protein
MGKLSKIMAKAEELAKSELEKRAQQQPGQPYAPPVIVPAQQFAQFSTPPPSPPPYAGSVFAGRPSTPPGNQSQSLLQQQQPATPATSSPSRAPALTPSPSSRGRRKALLIACSYPGTRAQLRGPSNDIQCMQYLLTSKFGFSPSQIVVLRDDDHSRGREFIPYRDVIMRACSWLVADAKPGDSLFFQYSGHGGRMKDPTCEQQRLPADSQDALQLKIPSCSCKTEHSQCPLVHAKQITPHTWDRCTAPHLSCGYPAAVAVLTALAATASVMPSCVSQ